MKKYYTLTVRALSPVHIGCQEQFTKLDYCYAEESGYVYIMHPHKLFLGLRKLDLLGQYEERIINADAQFSLTLFLAEHQITEDVYRTWARYSYPTGNVSVDNGRYGIFPFVKDGCGRPYVPGSSLKGVLRTAIAYKKIQSNREDFRGLAFKLRNAIDHDPRVDMEALRKCETALNQKIFYTLKRNKGIQNDCMAGLMISDSRPISPDSLCLCQKIDVDYEGFAQERPIQRECLAPETEITFDVTLDDKLCPFDMKAILAALREQFEVYDTAFRAHYRKAVKDTFHDPAQGKEPWLYLGGGTGFLHKTVVYALFEKAEAARLTAALLEDKFPSPEPESPEDECPTGPEHKKFTHDHGYSPKVWKCTRLHEQLYEMGLCSIRMEEKRV